MGLLVPVELRERILSHAAEAAPEEACGFLVGREGPDRVVTRVRPARNEAPAGTERFFIRPEEIADLDGSLEGTDERLLGFYHSHVRGPTGPSEADRAVAFPGFSYVVVAPTLGGEPSVTSWRLRPDGSGFDGENLQIV